jgi:hypothetical protein
MSDGEGSTVVELECGEGGWCSRNVVFHDKQNPKGVKVTADVNRDADSAEGYLSEDGKYFVAEFSAWNKPYEVALFDVLNRKPLWGKKFMDEIVASIAVSPQGNFVFVYTGLKGKREFYNYIYGKNGELLIKQQFEYPGNRYYAFGSKEQHAVIATSKGELCLFDLKSSKLLWKYFTGDKNVGFLDVDYSSGYIAASVTTRNPKDISDGSLPRYLYVLNIDGDLLLKKKIIDHGFKRRLAEIQVRIKNSGRKILINLPDKLLEYENEFAK